jgi:type IV pilus assembly protein PilB
MDFTTITNIASKKAPSRNPSVSEGRSTTLDDELNQPTVSVIRLVDLLVEHAHAAGSSDIHLDPRPDGLLVRLRVDGVLRDTHHLPKRYQHEIIARIKILCGLRTDEHQAAQDGRFRAELVSGSAVDVRVSIVPTYHGENGVMRLLASQAREHSLETLDFTSANQEKIIRAAKRPFGMILATGPTGSGKTTTLYTLVKELNHPEVSIITIEDPVEYAISGINQIQINPRTNLTFANGLRSMLRQDPNIIMVGEIRDTETAGLAVNTALTGHLVLSTLHTNDAPTTLPRLLDMRVEPYLIASTVNIAIGQRLVRRICSHCIAERKLTGAERESLRATVPDRLLEAGDTFFVGRGCAVCRNTGFKGRVGIHEVMEVDTPVREAILRKASAAEIRSVAIAQGMIPMLEDGFQKAMSGATTIPEVLRLRHE